MATVIDYGAYPHLIEAIVALAPLGALVPLRATCRSIKRQVDARLFTHAQLHEFPTASDDWDSAVTHGLTLPANSGVQSDRALPSLPRAASAVAVLDADFELVPRAVAAQFTSLRTLRRRLHCASHFDDPFPAVKSAVYFVTVPARYIVVGRLPRQLDRLVLHLRHEGTGAPADDFRLVTGGRIKQFEFVLWPSLGRSPLPFWFMSAIFETVADGRRDAPPLEDFDVTIVGLENAYGDGHTDPATTGSIGFDHEEIKRSMRDTFRELLHTRRLNMPRGASGVIHTLGRKLRIVTLKEWHAEIGDRMEMEGAWMETRR
ncbi:hypothetical protein Q8F55_000048 [Vanrija albida]|uniref:F-box domain-containing protein n=1 Tax=Vanrija albida TaxID=181172 RepID=A0ABR3QC65_9TREE